MAITKDQPTTTYKEERFEFALYVNNNIICKRNFKINDFWLGTILEEQIDDLTMQCGIIVIQNRSEHSAVVTGLFDVRDF